MPRLLPILKFTNEDSSEILTIDVDAGSYDSYGSVKSKTITITETADGQRFSNSLPISVSNTNEGSFRQIAEWEREDNGSKTATIPDSLISSSTLYFSINGNISEAIPNELATTTIQISCSTPDSQIYYTLDNSTPDSSKSLYSNQFEVESGTTIKAIAIKEGYIDSDIAEYVVN